MRALLFLLGLRLVLPLAPARAAPCDRLSGELRQLTETIFRETYPHDCCDETLDRCLKQRRVCKLARRLRDDICRRVGRGEDAKKVKHALERRARSMTPGKRATFDLSRAVPAGEANAPVQVVVYACARCPFCSKVIPELHRLAASSALRGKVALHFRPFPISGHKGSAEGGLAFVAAARLGRFWLFALKLYAGYKQFAPEKLPEWASQVGMDRAAFGKEMAAAATRQALVEAKKEGLRNGVNATPTLFINGRKYVGDLDRESLLDVLEEEADRVGKRSYCEGSGR